MKTIEPRRLLAIFALLLACFIHSPAFGAVIIGHRGYSALAPENTIASIEAAAPFAWGIEIDIRPTVDGQYILMHDGTVDRTTDGTGAVNTLTFDYIRSLDAGSWKSPVYAGEQVPTVIEAINASMTNNLKLCIEIKTDGVTDLQGMASDMYSILSPYSEYIEVHSFNETLLQSIANLGGDFTYVLIGSGDLDAKVGNLQPCIDKVSWGYSGITQSSIDALHAMNKPIYAWTVNNTSTALSLIDQGVDAVLTDNPEALVNALNLPVPPETSYPCRLKDSLAAHWAFDEGLTDPTTRTAADSTGGKDATFLDALDVPSAWKTGSEAKVGGAVELDGVDDTTFSLNGGFLDVPKDGVTMATWVKLDTLPQYMTASYGSIYDSSEDAYVLYLDKGTKELRMKISASAAARPGIPQSMLDTSQWHYVVGVYDGGAGTAQIYLDGQLVDIESNGESPLTGFLSSQIATIGSSVGTNYFDGKLDEMSIWGRALGQAEIAYMYNQGQGRAMPEQNVFVGAPTPVVRYKFETNLTNSGSGGSVYDATLHKGSGTTSVVEGVEGDFALDITNPHVTSGGDYLDTSYNLTQTGAISFWCKPTEYYDSNTLFNASTDADNWEMWIDSTGVAKFRIEDDSLVTCQLDDADEWYHLAMTWSKVGSEVIMNLFLDGEMVDFDKGVWADSTNTLQLLGGDIGNMHGNAALDDFRVYDSLLTSDEIMAIYLQKEQPPVYIPGDANKDGYVDGSDATILAGYWQQTNATWEMGDFNDDGVVDGSDATILAGYWQTGTPPATAAVPEPSTIVLLLCTALFGVLSFRRYATGTWEFCRVRLNAPSFSCLHEVQGASRRTLRH